MTLTTADITTFSKEEDSSEPGKPFHKFTGISEGIDEQEEWVPQTSASKHTNKVQLPIFTDVIYYCQQQNSEHIRMHQNTNRTVYV